MHSEKKSYATVGFQCWQRFNPSAKQSQRSDKTTHVLVLQGSFALTLCLHSHFVKMVFNSEQMDVWLKTYIEELLIMEGYAFREEELCHCWFSVLAAF